MNETLILSKFHFQEAIRAEDSSKLIFFESITFDNFRGGFSEVPGGKQFANMSVFAYHYYNPPNFRVHQTFKEKIKEASRMKCGSFLTEFGLPTPDSSDSSRNKFINVNEAVSLVRESRLKAGMSVDFPPELEDLKSSEIGRSFGEVTQKDALEVLEAADANVQSWIAWEYKSYVNKTGTNYGPFHADGTINKDVAKLLARTYPIAVAGTIVDFSFNFLSSEFVLTYIAGLLSEELDPESFEMARTTEVWFSKEYCYPNGFKVSVEPNTIELTHLDSSVLIKHLPSLQGSKILFRLFQNVV